MCHSHLKLQYGVHKLGDFEALHYDDCDVGVIRPMEVRNEGMRGHCGEWEVGGGIIRGICIESCSMCQVGQLERPVVSVRW
jgi:hypothetical protein